MEYVDGSTVAVCFTKADTLWPMFYFLVVNSMFYLGPFVLLIFMYWVIARHLMADPGTNCSESAFNVRARKQVVAMLITVVVAFFLCLLPFRVFTLWIILAPGDYLPNVKMDTYYYILFSCRIMLYLNSAINPILYNLMSSKFRQGFVNLIPCVRNGDSDGSGWGCRDRRSRNRRRNAFRLRCGSNTLSTSLSHSSTKVSILARTGSSLLLRQNSGCQPRERGHRAFRSVGVADKRNRGKMESDASACAGTADDNRNHNHGQHQNQDLQQLPTTAAAAHTVAVFQFIVGQTESFV